MIAELDPVSAARLGNGNTMVSRKRLYRHPGFLTAILGNNPEMHFAIGWRFVAKRGRPIDFPISKERMGISRDPKKNRPPIGTRKFAQGFRNRGTNLPGML